MKKKETVEVLTCTCDGCGQEPIPKVVPGHGGSRELCNMATVRFETPGTAQTPAVDLCRVCVEDLVSSYLDPPESLVKWLRAAKAKAADAGVTA